MESWKSVGIDGGRYSDRYQVSDCGRVRSHPGARVKGSKSGRVLSQSFGSKGYRQVNLCKDNRQHSVKVHRLVAAAFLGPKPDGLQVNHIDGDKNNNHVSNLEYVTAKENTRHAHRVIGGRFFIEVFGEKLCVPEATEKYGHKSLSPQAVYRRIHRLGWNAEEALTTPNLGVGIARGQNAYK